RGLLDSDPQIGFEIESAVVPIGFAVHHVREIPDAEDRHEAFPRCGSGNPRRPASATFFGTRRVTGKHLTSGRVTRTVINLAPRDDLRCGEARVRCLAGLALDARRIEPASPRIGEDVVRD